MRTIPEVAENIKSILNNIERTENCDGETLVDINELVDEIITISAYKRKKLTNADRIRSMSDEELAEFMADKGGYIACCQCDYFNHDDEKCEKPSGWKCTKSYGEELIHSWLQSEAEE